MQGVPGALKAGLHNAVNKPSHGAPLTPASVVLCLALPAPVAGWQPEQDLVLYSGPQQHAPKVLQSPCDFDPDKRTMLALGSTACACLTCSHAVLPQRVNTMARRGQP
jgi:hypothetical protein